MVATTIFYSRSQSLLAMPVESYVGKTINDTLPPDVASLWLTALSEANAQGVSAGKQYQLSLPQGNRWFRAFGIAQDDSAFRRTALYFARP
ncbi:MAG: hypothetical protein IPJ25_03885 [Rhodocyclaceae bacterium]|nr:hypothetical protein [Rhodocyclaceae bacterium]